MRFFGAFFSVFILFVVPAHGQEHFQLKGQFKLDSSNSKAIHYTLNWQEEGSKLTGTYQDDYFKTRATVSGTKDALGRNFTATFPETVKGIKSINFLSSQLGSRATATTIPVSIITRDSIGSPLTNTSSSSQFVSVTPLVAERQEEALCREGFGSLRGYCGVYEGLITEELDRGDDCNLLFAEAVRLQLTLEGEVNLLLGVMTEVTAIPIHRIGRIPADPVTTSIDILGRQCRPISGTSFPSDNCKRLHLIGRFSLREVTRHFTGVYSITDELTNNVCRYSLSMDLR